MKIEQLKVPVNLGPTVNPDGWVIIEVRDENETFFKVFGSWFGGYLDGDYWRLNSGIKKVAQDDTHYYFYGFSGSCYKCAKNAYGIKDGYSLMNLSELIRRGGGLLKVLEDKVDWTKI